MRRLLILILIGLMGMTTSACVAQGLPSSISAQAFAQWLSGVRTEAAQQGISQATIATALPPTLKPLKRVVKLDRKQPETVRSFENYIHRIVNERRVKQGRDAMLDNRRLLDLVSNTYGVPPEYIVALWGGETNYGRNTGGFSVVQALATLAYDGRRSAFFRAELFKALKILDEKDIDPAGFKGSWAGAMGQVQFMPSSFWHFAVDFDHDGRKDIWDTPADVFASTANYLALSGWKQGQPWGHEVVLPKGFDTGLIGQKHDLQFWYDKGVRLKDGKSIPFEGADSGTIIQPDEGGAATFIVYDNYNVFLSWNKSTYFALSVGLLADKLHGW